MMTLSQITTRIGTMAGAVAVSSVLLFVAPVHAAPNNSNYYYQVELAQTVPAQKEQVRGVLVKCEGTECRAPVASSSARNVCISIAREFGEVSAFRVEGKAFDAEQIAACNGKGKMKVAKK
jgi:hypothetical protein